MKKVFAILAISGALIACNNDSEGTESKDTTTKMTDTTIVTPPVDTTVVDTMNKMMGDTTKK
jgi:hypothetical protein